MNDFEVTQAPGRLVIFLSPKLRFIDRAGEETERFLGESGAGVSPFGVLLIMREALTNALLYWSRQEEVSRVRYSLSLDAGTLTMEVEDHGDGFDWKSQTAEVPDMNLHLLCNTNGCK